MYIEKFVIMSYQDRYILSINTDINTIQQYGNGFNINLDKKTDKIKIPVYISSKSNFYWSEEMPYYTEYFNSKLEAIKFINKNVIQRGLTPFFIQSVLIHSTDKKDIRRFKIKYGLKIQK